MPLIVVGVAFALLGLLSIPWGIVVWWRAVRGDASMARARGKVVDLQLGSTDLADNLQHLGTSNLALYYPVVDFVGPSGLVRFVDGWGSRPASYRVGDTVKIRSPRDTPAAAQIDKAVNNLMPAIPFVMGLVFLIVGAAVTVGSLVSR